MSCPVLCCPVLCCPVLCCPVLCCPVLCCPVLSCPPSSALSSFVLSCPLLSSSKTVYQICHYYHKRVNSSCTVEPKRQQHDPCCYLHLTCPFIFYPPCVLLSFYNPVGMFVLHCLEALITPPPRYPDLYPALFALYGTCNLLVVYILGVTWQWSLD